MQFHRTINQFQLHFRECRRRDDLHISCKQYALNSPIRSVGTLRKCHSCGMSICVNTLDDQSGPTRGPFNELNRDAHICGAFSVAHQNNVLGVDSSIIRLIQGTDPFLGWRHNNKLLTHKTRLHQHNWMRGISIARVIWNWCLGPVDAHLYQIPSEYERNWKLFGSDRMVWSRPDMETTRLPNVYSPSEYCPPGSDRAYCAQSWKCTRNFPDHGLIRGGGGERRG